MLNLSGRVVNHVDPLGGDGSGCENWPVRAAGPAGEPATVGPAVRPHRGGSGWAPSRPAGPRRPQGVAPSLRLEDAGDAKPAWIILLTTEHYNLRMQRVATISESNGRASVFLGAVAAGLIALGLESTRGAGPVGRMIVQVLVLTPLVFLGLVAFVRCLEIAIDDWEFVARITRLRCTSDQLVPELAPLMSLAVADDRLVARLSPRWQPFQKMLSVAGSVAMITSVVVGGGAGVSASQPERSPPSDGRAGISGATGVRRPGRRPETSRRPSRSRGRATAATSWGPRTSSPGCCGLRASPVDMGSLAAGSRVQ